ncbi:hypothetical protein [Vibrio paracholerae]|uniref:Uncharacterized protein n=1 Tax=Vibrio paracholerae TaxID=650003 RepID=A0ABD7FUV7_9VIBR|nr:hypothetical protein [Vibrio paracholerae]RBM65604.1 hypothetical protein DLR72_12900 [Vibrio paracholerae]
MMTLFRVLILALMLVTNLSLAMDPPDAPESTTFRPSPMEAPDNPLPTIFYRTDTRPPYINAETSDGQWVDTPFIGQGVFEVGLHPLGDDKNLADHVHGGTTFGGTGTTNFVALTTGENFHVKWGPMVTGWPLSARKHGKPYQYIKETFFVYALRPNNHIYNMYDTFMINKDYLIEINKGKLTEAQMQNKVDTYRHQEEWVAFGHTPIDHIMWADEYRIGHPEPIFVRRITNPLFVSAPTFPSRNPLVIPREETRLSFLDQVRRVFSTPDGQTYPIAFLSCMSFLHNFRHRDPREIDGSDDLDICPELKYTYVPKSVQIVRNPQNIKVEMKMQVPWYSVYKATNYYNREYYPDNCTVEIQDYHLYVRCNATPPYPTSYFLHLGAGGPANTWIDQSCIFSFSEQEANGQFVVNIRDLHVVGSQYALALYDYTIKQAFSGTGGWWSNITITPIYPVLPDEQPSNCIWNRSRNHEL